MKMKGLHPLSGQDLCIYQYTVDSSNSNPIYKYGPVMLINDGHAEGQDAASSADAYIGPAMGIYDSDKIEVSYLASSTAGYVDVATNPKLKLLVQADAAVEETDRGNLSDLASFAGSTTTGNSTAQLDATTGTGCAQFRIIDKANFPGNDWGDSDIMLIVEAFEHAMNPGAQTAGI